MKKQLTVALAILVLTLAPHIGGFASMAEGLSMLVNKHSRVLQHYWQRLAT